MNGAAMQEAVRQRLEELAKGGRLTAAAVVEDAKQDESPLHGFFEWDDSVAAKRYRLAQARRLIRSVEVVVISDARIVSTVAYVRDPDAKDGEPGYTQTVTLRDDKTRARQAVLNEVSRAAAYLARVRSLSAALGMEDEVLALEEKFAEFRARVEIAA